MKILIIQTAFIGDVVLATAVCEKLHTKYPTAKIDFLLRKGNESLFANHPYLNNILIWDKKKDKLKNLFSLLKTIRKNKYDYVFNLQRFASSGILTAFSNAKNKIGFDKNPFSFLFTQKIKHQIGDAKNIIHEVERNHKLIGSITDSQFAKPRLYPSTEDFEAVKKFQQKKHITIAPTSVWFTKQFPAEKWCEFIASLSDDFCIYLLGGKNDELICNEIANKFPQKEIKNLAGKLSFLQSAALMQNATRNFVNDSAPMHFCSATNAPVTAVFCSTLPAFGFGPLSDDSIIAETQLELTCRPCGLHGKKSCPEKHFNCAYSIDIYNLKKTLYK